MEKFVWKYLKYGRYTLCHPYTVKMSFQSQGKSNKLNFSLNKSHVSYYLCHLNFFVFLVFTCWDIVLLATKWKGYQETQNYVHLTFHLLWIICALNGLTHHLPNSLGAIEVMQLNNGLIGLNQHLEKCKHSHYKFQTNFYS